MKFECARWILEVLVDCTTEHNPLGKKLGKALVKSKNSGNTGLVAINLTVGKTDQIGEVERVMNLMSGMRVVLNNHISRLEQP